MATTEKDKARAAEPGEISPETGQPAGGPPNPNTDPRTPTGGSPSSPRQEPVTGKATDSDDAAPAEVVELREPAVPSLANTDDVETLRAQVRDLQARLAEAEGAPEPGDDDPAAQHTCKNCGAKFSGEGSRKAYRQHMESFHPDPVAA